METVQRILFNEVWPGLLLFWIAWYVPAVSIFCATQYCFLKKRGQWERVDYLLLIIPYFLWAFLMVADVGGKGWANVTYEPLTIALICGAAISTRLLLPSAVLTRMPRWYVLAAVAISALLVWALFPDIRTPV